MPAGIALRPAREDDAEFLYRVYASTRTDELAVVPWSVEQKEAFLRMQFHAQHTDYHRNFPDAAFLIVESNHEAIGRVYLDRRHDEFRVVDIALLPERRGRGLGAALMRNVMAEAAAEMLPVRIHVERFNPAQRLYERLGFRRIGDTGVYYLMEWNPHPAPR